MRADIYIFVQGYTKSRQCAKNLIESGNVFIDKKRVLKPSLDIDEGCPHELQITNTQRFVSRGGEKLDAALEKFAVDVCGLKCIDIGASTGGFTDCLLQRGADRVYAIDSGHSQLDASLLKNEKIVSIEKYNAKFMKCEDFPHKFDIAVMDVSFISQTLIHKGIYSVLNDGGILISLIKPQFECGRHALNSKGIVKKASHREEAICKVLDSALMHGFSCIDIMRSPIEGGSGNVEFLAFLKKESNPQNQITDNKIKNILQAK